MICGIIGEISSGGTQWISSLEVTDEMNGHFITARLSSSSNQSVALALFNDDLQEYFVFVIYCH